MAASAVRGDSGAEVDAATGAAEVNTSLGCGTNADTVLDQVAEGRGAERDAHQAGCLHCEAALAEYTRLWAPVDELAATATPAPASTVDRALVGIRRQSEPSGWGRVTDHGGSFLVTARAVAAVAGHAARIASGVRMALGALDVTEPVGAAAEVSEGAITEHGAEAPGPRLKIDLRVAADYGRDLHALAGQVRERVVAQVRARTGLEVAEVDVTITDVFAPHTGPT